MAGFFIISLSHSFYRKDSPMYVVCIVVDDNNNYLLIEEAKAGCRNTWCLPAGGIEKNESITDAAIRETIEESGIYIKPTGFFFIDHVPRDNWIRFALLAKPVGGELKTRADEHSLRAGWFSPDSLVDLPLRDQCVKELIFKHKSGDFSLLSIESYNVYA